MKKINVNRGRFWCGSDSIWPAHEGEIQPNDGRNHQRGDQ